MQQLRNDTNSNVKAFMTFMKITIKV